jgi:hypothetical protein
LTSIIFALVESVILFFIFCCVFVWFSVRFFVCLWGYLFVCVLCLRAYSLYEPKTGENSRVFSTGVLFGMGSALEGVVLFLFEFWDALGHHFGHFFRHFEHPGPPLGRFGCSK